MAVYPAVIVGTDGSSTASEAVRRGASFARAVDAPLLIVTAYKRPLPEEIGPPSLRAGLDEEQLLSASYRAATDTVADAAQMARAVADGLAVDTVTPEGDPAECLLEESERRPGSVLVVGSQGMTGSRRFLLGSIPNKISHHAVSDVMIVRTGIGTASGEPHAHRRLLVAVDGSPTAARAATRAVEITVAADAHLTILTVADDEQAATRVLDEASEQAVRLGARVATVWRSGDPSDGILAEGAGHDLVVVGNRGMTGAGRFLLGSVPNNVSHHSTTDLLIVNTDAQSFRPGLGTAAAAAPKDPT